MKLYFSPGACSLSPHICLRETGAKFDIDQVDFGTKKTKSGTDYTKVNPKGYVPALQLDNGEVLTEGPAIVQYVADQKPESGLMPKAGTMERYRAQEWLNFITSELHKAYSHLFSPATPDAYKAAIKEKLGTRYDFLAKQLDGKPFLMGSQFSAPDAYLFTILGWNPHVGMNMDKWSTLKAYSDRVAARPAVQVAMKAEGLIK
jgi:glutathione S-transferase